MQMTKALPSRKDLRAFALIVSAGFLLIGWGIPIFKKNSMNPFLVSISVIILILGMIAPKILIRPREYWIKVGSFLGKINSVLLFTLIFFLVFTPIAFIFRLFGRDRLHTNFKAVKSTMIKKQEISSFNEPF